MHFSYLLIRQCEWKNTKYVWGRYLTISPKCLLPFSRSSKLFRVRWPASEVSAELVAFLVLIRVFCTMGKYGRICMPWTSVIFSYWKITNCPWKVLEFWFDNAVRPLFSAGDFSSLTRNVCFDCVFVFIQQRKTLKKCLFTPKTTYPSCLTFTPARARREIQTSYRYSKQSGHISV